MEKQPNSRMCFVCGIESPIGPKLKFYGDGEDRCIAHLSSHHPMLDTFDIDRYNVMWLNID